MDPVMSSHAAPIDMAYQDNPHQRPFFPPEQPGETTQHQPPMASTSPSSERTLFHPPPNHPTRSLSTAAPQALYSTPVELPQTADTTQSMPPTFTSHDTSNYNISYSNQPPIPESYIESDKDPEKSFPTFVQTGPNNHYSTPTLPVNHTGADNRRKKILGVEMTNTVLVCLAVVLVIIAALFGGLAGGGVLDQKSEPVTSTSTTTTTTTTSGVTIISTPVTSTPVTTTPTTPSTTTTTSGTGTQPDWVYPIATGIWNLDGKFSLDGGTCISNKTSPTETAVWYCDETEFLTVTIRGGGEPRDYSYWLDIDEPVRRRGIQGKPPTITWKESEEKKAGSVWWAFEVPYKTQAFPNREGCEVEINLTVLLGASWSDWALFQSVTAPNECVLPSGGNSTAGLFCQCAYLDDDLKKLRRSDLKLSKRYLGM